MVRIKGFRKVFQVVLEFVHVHSKYYKFILLFYWPRQVLIDRYLEWNARLILFILPLLLLFRQSKASGCSRVYDMRLLHILEFGWKENGHKVSLLYSSDVWPFPSPGPQKVSFPQLKKNDLLCHSVDFSPTIVENFNVSRPCLTFP